jgi:branched-chain amino acid transport system substrate-binding protein
MTTRRVRPMAAVSILVLLAACGDDDATESGTESSAAPSSDAPVTSVAPEPSAPVVTSAVPDPSAAVTSAVSGSTAAPTNPAEPSGEPIVIGQINPVESTTVSIPDGARSARMAVEAINANGGVQGRPLVIIQCDEKNDPNAASACAQKLVNEDNVIAMVGNCCLQGPSVYPVLEAAGVANFGPGVSSTDDLQNELSFPFGAGFAGFGGLAGLADPDVDRVAFIHSDSTGARGAYALAKPVYESHGIELVDIEFPAGQIDFTPVVAQVRQADVDAMTAAAAATTVQQIISAAQTLQLDIPMYINSQISETAVQQLSDSGADVRVALTYGMDPDQFPRRQQYNDELAEYGSEIEDPVSDNTVTPWLAVHTFAEVAENIPNIDRASFLSYLEENPRIETGLTQPIDFSEPVIPEFPRLFNQGVLPGTIEDGQLVQTSDEWFNAVQ